jgi:2-amino-4-hydroxy-6-hydroxymethyldihydropteridine diphosphokinase
MNPLTKTSPHQIYISLGSNLGDLASNLLTAIAHMGECISNIQKSPVYETPPWGVLAQPAFLNMVITGTTLLTPIHLLAFLKNIEVEMGRVKTMHWGPRVIDLDILLYDNLQFHRSRLTIPHANMCERAFVLIPMADLAPQLVIPGTDRTVTQWLQTVDRSGITRLS